MRRAYPTDPANPLISGAIGSMADNDRSLGTETQSHEPRHLTYRPIPSTTGTIRSHIHIFNLDLPRHSCTMREVNLVHGNKKQDHGRATTSKERTKTWPRHNQISTVHQTTPPSIHLITTPNLTEHLPLQSTSGTMIPGARRTGAGNGLKCCLRVKNRLRSNGTMSMSRLLYDSYRRITLANNHPN